MYAAHRGFKSSKAGAAQAGLYNKSPAASLDLYTFLLFSIFSTCTLSAMIEFLNNIDTSVFLAINGHHSPFFDSFMMLFTGRFIWIPMYAMVLWIFFRGSNWKNALIYLGAIALTIALTDQTCASLIRPAVERLRPSNLANSLSELTYTVNEYRGGRYGFPSCHSANSFALATFMSLFVRKRGFTVFIFAWALLNSYSRLYLGVHYPGDLLVGGIIGSIFAMLCYTVASRFESPAARSQRLPRLAAPIISLRAPLAAEGRSLAVTPSLLMEATCALTLSAILIASLLH